MTINLTEPRALTAQKARERNEQSYRTTCAFKELPEWHVAVRATETAVLLTATDMDVLAEWLYVQGGSITTVDLPSGQTVWTLHTQTWTDSEQLPVVPVHLSVVLPSDESVMWEIREAVKAA